MIYLLLYLIAGGALGIAIGCAFRTRDEEEQAERALDKLNNSHW